MKKFLYVVALVMVGVFALGYTKAQAVESTWHGQFRINSYLQAGSDDGTFTETDDIQASRLRWRPTWDLKFDNGVAMHMQLNIGHIKDNLSNARTDNGGNPAVALRHAYVLAPIPDVQGWSVIGGLVPLPDKFGDTLFSSDWDFNPLVFAILGKVGDIDVRVGHAMLSEGREGHGDGTNNLAADDIDAWVFDVDTPVGLGASYYALNVNSANMNQHYIGVRFAKAINGLDVNAWGIYNWGKQDLTSTTDAENTGYALKGAVKVPVGPAKIGVMGLYATGDKDYGSSTVDSDSFITPMSLIGHTGYWGFTGKLNVQGPTDTGIDGQAMNIDGANYDSGTGLGEGMVTAQANASFPVIADRLDAYLAAGWYQAVDTAASVDDSIGTDLLAMGTYHFGGNLNLDFGIDYVTLGKGHPDNRSANESRNMTLLFSRFQMEF